MVLSLYSLLEAILLVVNAAVILDERRFLAKVGWDRNSIDTMSTYDNNPYGPPGGGGGGPSHKAQFLHLLHSIRTVARVPLIFINIFVIGFKLLLG